MAKYFNYFPKTFYNLDDKKNSVDVVTNIIARFSFQELLKQNSAVFYPYEIKDSDTPEIIASKYYGNPERHWIVLLFNDIIDSQFDWPLQYRVFNEYVDKKYSAPEYADTANTSVSGLSWAKSQSNVQSYYKVIKTILNSEGTSYTDKIEIDQVTYNSLSNSTTIYPLQNNTTITETISKEIKTYYDYEEELNEQKRQINLLKTEFVPEIEREFKRVVKL
jgi:hypothetical protein